MYSNTVQTAETPRASAYNDSQ